MKYAGAVYSFRTNRLDQTKRKSKIRVIIYQRDSGSGNKDKHNKMDSPSVDASALLAKESIKSSSNEWGHSETSILHGS